MYILKKYFWVNFTIIFTVIVGCSSEKQPNQNEMKQGESSITLTEQQYKNALISLGKLEERSISSTLHVSGKIDVPPQNVVSISVPFGGYLKSTHLLPGMHIQKGEVLAVIEDQFYIQLQQDYLIALARIKYLEKEFARQRELNKTKSSSDRDFQLAESEFQSQKILTNALREKLRLLSIDPDKLNENNISRSIQIKSPIQGVVSRVKANIGKYIPATDVLFELINPTDIHLNFFVFEKDLEKLRIGQKVVAYTNYKAEKKHQCEIILIGSDMNEDRTAEVHCHFLDYDKTLVPGMYMNADVNVDNHFAASLPEEAVVMFENRKYVFVAGANRSFELVNVETGAEEAGTITIDSPQQLQGKNIVVKGAYALLMKLKNQSDE